MIWKDQYFIGALITILIWLTAILVFIIWRNSKRTVVQNEVFQCNMPGLGSSSPSQSSYTTSYIESNKPVCVSSSYNKSTKYEAPLIISNNHRLVDGATSLPQLPHLLQANLGRSDPTLGRSDPTPFHPNHTPQDLSPLPPDHHPPTTQPPTSSGLAEGATSANKCRS